MKSLKARNSSLANVDEQIDILEHGVEHDDDASFLLLVRFSTNAHIHQIKSDHDRQQLA